MSQTQDLAKKVPRSKVADCHTTKPVREVYLRLSFQKVRVAMAALSIFCSWIWFVITSVRAGITHFSKSWLCESVQVSLSTLSACNPTFKSYPNLSLPRSQQILKSITRISLSYLKNASLTDMNVRMSCFCSIASVLPWLYLTLL